MAIALTQRDPTQTLTLRKQFVNQYKLRFRYISRLVNESIIINDCFGINNITTFNFIRQEPIIPSNEFWQLGMRPIQPSTLKFSSNTNKAVQFMSWLKEMEQKGLFQVLNSRQIGKAINPIWQNVYISTAYKHGILWARRRLRENRALMIALGLTTKDIPVDDESIQESFTAPVHADSIGLIYTRAFNDIEGITSAMDAQISRELAESLVLGYNPRIVAKKIVDRIEKIGIARAIILARTEIIRAHHLASIQTYENYGVEGVSILAEWATARDARVCPLCKPLEGKIFTLKEIKGKIPVHPQCRCAAIPVLIE